MIKHAEIEVSNRNDLRRQNVSIKRSSKQTTPNADDKGIVTDGEEEEKHVLPAGDTFVKMEKSGDSSGAKINFAPSSSFVPDSNNSYEGNGGSTTGVQAHRKR